ncbi:GNAT family N-acetyltransferase [Pseudoduganella lutea]|uniref:L-ornithine N(alpha)-acyltransferase n=1 Tax=Pseudoduganella lutea TaxID=321985 RepID=A0A4P6KTQ0_9BURK|nr:GNAT family N-acyltransferase [Pseudoduganella lutea]QBE62054.1 GNAT family N-acetyltransferase [Pseudoduganella lutea]
MQQTTIQQTNTAAGVRAPRPRLATSIATTAEELREAQRLRYRVFIEGMNLTALARPDGLDCDEFDEHCDHLLVRDTSTLQVVGTYRVLAPAGARRLGRFYSEGEFDVGRLNPLRGRIIEAGRACIHPDYRGGSVIMLLWAALGEYMRRQGCDYLAGCASISLADGGHNAVAVFRQLRETHMAPAEYRVTPHLPFPHTKIEPAAAANVPALLKGYMRSGAWLCGEPAWDPDFDSADLFLLMPLANLDARYARHYGVDGAVEMAIAA